jgi:hypothetical protein
MKRKPESGVTLIELLVVISLLSAVTLGLLMAMRVGFGAMERANASINATRRVLGVDRVFSQQIAGFIPSKIDCRTAPNAPAVSVSFFHGEPATMRFLSSYSLEEAGRGYPRILEYLVIPGADGRGVRLVVNERLYPTPAAAAGLCLGVVPDPLNGGPVGRYVPVQAGAGSFVLADRLAYCRFLYREDLPSPPGAERWVPAWNRQRWPGAIRVEMAPLEPDPSRLQVVTLTQPIRVTRDPFLTYVN